VQVLLVLIDRREVRPIDELDDAFPPAVPYRAALKASFVCFSSINRSPLPSCLDTRVPLKVYMVVLCATGS